MEPRPKARDDKNYGELSLHSVSAVVSNADVGCVRKNVRFRVDEYLKTSETYGCDKFRMRIYEIHCGWWIFEGVLVKRQSKWQIGRFQLFRGCLPIFYFCMWHIVFVHQRHFIAWRCLIWLPSHFHEPAPIAQGAVPLPKILFTTLALILDKCAYLLYPTESLFLAVLCGRAYNCTSSTDNVQNEILTEAKYVIFMDVRVNC